MGAKKVLKMIEENDVKWVDFRFTDTRGKEQHVTVPASLVDEDLFEEGKMFDGSSIAGWKGINESDMILMPEAGTAVLDPFTDDATVNLRCDILEPSTMEGYERDPRSVAKRAEAYLQSTGIADAAYFGPEPEFFVLDDVRWSIDMSGSMAFGTQGDSKRRVAARLAAMMAFSAIKNGDRVGLVAFADSVERRCAEMHLARMLARGEAAEVDPGRYQRT